MPPFLFILFVCSLLSFTADSLQSADYQIYNAEGNLIAIIEDNQLKDNHGDVLYNYKGKIIYSGETDRRRDIHWLVQISNFQGNRSGKLNKPNHRESAYTIFRSAFYHGNQVMDRKINLMLTFDFQENEILLKRGLEETIIGKITGNIKDTPPIICAMIFEFLKEYTNIDAYVHEQILEWGGSQTQSLGEGTIKRLWDGTRSEYVWDGKTLKKRWVAGSDEWSYDGRIIRNMWTGSEDEFEWDGHILRRRWGTTPDEFVFDGSSFRSRYGSGHSYVIQGNIVRQQFGTGDRDEWEMQGNIPVPLIMLIVYRVIR